MKASKLLPRISQRMLDGMKFSHRTGWEAGENDWARAVREARAGGREIFDLTLSNPGACGLGPLSAEVLAPLSDPGALGYTPDPLGMLSARDAVSAYYRDHGTVLPPERVCITTSTSEAYSYLFRLLCDPGDEILIARPSYPLFDLLARLDDVVLREYALFYEPGSLASASGRWSVDVESLRRGLSDRTRAVVVVHPNNPTGNFVGPEDRALLLDFCAEHGLALIVDEVFLDYGIEPGRDDRSFVQDRAGCLCFALSGLSKICALPQMKLSWIAVCGPEDLVASAMERLEIVADTFLSVNAPVQFALSAWLGARRDTQAAIKERLRDNLAALDRRLQGSLGERLRVEGGWTAVLRVPRQVDGVEFSMAAVGCGVIVQPGVFYGLPEGRCVLSLLTDPAVWRSGLGLLPL